MPASMDIVTGSMLEQIVVKLSCQAFGLESDRDHWRSQATSLQEQLTQSQTALTHALKENSESRRRLRELRTQLHRDQIRQAEVDYQLRAIALAASVTGANLQEEGEESSFVKDTLHTLQGIVNKNDVRRTLLSTRKNGPDRRGSLPSSAYWDDTTSESD